MINNTIKPSIVMLTILACASAIGEVQPVMVFSEHAVGTFEEQRFVGKTEYRTVQVENETVLKAISNGSASALFKSVDIDLKRTPFLNWRWRVENTYPIENQQVKAGDDYPARVYVVFRQGFFPWQTKALNYVWSNRPIEQSFWPNPFTDNAIMIPLRSAADKLGHWHSERVNIADDYYRVFGERIEKADGVAIMSDSDNSGSSSVAYYGDIRFSD